MSTDTNLGALFVVLGGIIHGSFALPMKRMEGAWKWENIWLVYSIVTAIVFPCALAFAMIPGLGDVYAAASGATLAIVALFGFGWGLGSTLFGLAISRVGIALTFAIVLGITSSIGSLLPLILNDPAQLFTTRGAILLTGLALVVSGIICCAAAGSMRDKKLKGAAAAATGAGFGTGLIICILSGLLSPMLNFSFVYGKPLQDAAAAAGASAAVASFAIWAPALAGGFLANAGYAIYLLGKNKSWSIYASGAPAWFWLGAVMMGIMWYGGLSLYGFGGSIMGSLGPVIGWPVFMSTVVIVGNIIGVLSGEWKGASSKARGMSWLGVAILVVAIVVISRAS